MKDFLIVAIVLAVLALAAFAVYKAKKSGKKCIGCPYSGNCEKCKNSEL